MPEIVEHGAGAEAVGHAAFRQPLLTEKTFIVDHQWGTADRTSVPDECLDVPEDVLGQRSAQLRKFVGSAQVSEWARVARSVLETRSHLADGFHLHGDDF